ncbi:ABC transporter ATP-binding protein [Candidatus Magnetomorum sp. HK-1]|nr:ABC transporter ATP-binding protein [Candidatus Magnetomorum sp. HK-1]
MKSDQKFAIILKNISKTFEIKDKKISTIRGHVFNFFRQNNKRKIHALNNINLKIQKGEFFGVIGRNGSGKSTLLSIIAGAYPPDRDGEISVEGKYMRLTLGLGFDEELTARENIFTNASMLGISIKKIKEKFDDIIEFSELHDFVNTKVKYFSSGMKIRLKFSIALHAEADIFLMDEFFGGVGDEVFQRKSKKIFDKAFVEGRTIVHVSHDLKTISQHCNRVLLLHKGEVVTIGSPDEVIKKYNKIIEE